MNRQIVIGVSGAQGVGKTTFCNDLKLHLDKFFKTKSIDIKGGVSRNLINKGIATDKLTRPNDYPLFFKAHFENAIESSEDLVILDRTFLDTFSYALINNNLHPNWLLFCQSIIKYLMTKIDIYFYIPVDPNVDLKDDGIRNIDKVFQLELGRSMEKVLIEYYSNHIKLSGSRSERVEFASSLLIQKLNEQL